jgi:hypothetical protein
MIIFFFRLKMKKIAMYLVSVQNGISVAPSIKLIILAV